MNRVFLAVAGRFSGFIGNAATNSNAPANGKQGQGNYQLLCYNLGILGDFSEVTGFSSLFAPEYGVDGKEYFIDMKLRKNPFHDFGDNHNTEEVAETLDDGMTKPGMEDLLDEFTNMTDEEIRDMIDQLRGTELAAAAQTAALSAPWTRVYRYFEQYDDQKCMQALFRGQSKFRTRMRNSWGEGYYRYLETKSDGNAVKYDEQRGGMMVGTDWNFRNHSKFGVSFGYSRPSVSSRFGRVDIDDYVIGGYSRTRVFRDYCTNLFVGYGLQNYDYLRRERTDRYTSKYNGRSLYASFEISRPFRRYDDKLTLTPLLALDYQQSWTDAFTEQDGPFPQRIEKGSADRLAVRIGISGKYYIHQHFDITANLQYAVLINGDKYTIANSQFASSPTSRVMQFRGVDLGRNMFTAGVGGLFYFKNDLMFFGNYDFDLADRTTSHTGTLGLIKRW